MHKKLDELKFSNRIPEKEQRIIKDFLNQGLSPTDLLSAHTFETPNGTFNFLVRHNNDLVVILNAWLELHGRTWDEIRYDLLCYAVKCAVGDWGGTEEEYGALVIDLDETFGPLPHPGFNEDENLNRDLLSTLDCIWKSQPSDEAHNVCLAHMVICALPEAPYPAIQKTINERLHKIRERRA